MPPTLARRYFFKLIANVTAVPVYLLMEAILPRALGPGAYGNYSFATNLFQQLSGFLDMGTSTCFYNSLSRRQRETPLFSFYMRIAGIVAILAGLASFFACWKSAGEWLLPDVPLWIAPLAALWAYLTWLGRVLRSANDALGSTIPSEIWRSAISVAGVVILLALYVCGVLDIRTLFLQQYLLLGASAIAFYYICKKHWQNEGLKIPLKLTKGQHKFYRHEFFDYSHPLFIQSLLSFLMLAAERWLLQWFDGSAQQGFFALSQKVSMACFLFVSAMTPLLMREFSISWGKNDVAAMGALMRRMAPILYVLASYFSCFTLVEGKALVEIFGGRQFSAAVVAVQIMALYPIHQAYGQVATSIFHATGKTSVLRNMTAIECVYGFAATWFLLAPFHLGGLNLGATGLAIKTVAAQFFSVNIYLWLASRFIPFHYWRNLCHQVIAVAAFLLLAWWARWLSLFLPFGTMLPRFVFSGAVYTAAVFAICAVIPSITGLSRKEIAELIHRFSRRAKG